MIAALLLFAPAVQAQEEVRFSASSPLAAPAEIGRRFRAIVEGSVDLAQERFVLYVPPEMPEAGYGLLVFVPPWDSGGVPRGWPAALDRLGVIYVAAQNSGNRQRVVDRRVPLALLAAINLMKSRKIDPDRVYVGGFSGGSRVAMRIALAYPDLFRGAFLDAGADPIGDSDNPVPPADLLRLFQERSRLAYVYGENDSINERNTMQSINSMRHWCQYSVWSEIIPWKGHEIATAQALSRAFDFLTESSPADLAKIEACRGALQ